MLLKDMKFIAITIAFCCLSVSAFCQELFISPVDTPFQLSGTFGELRANHYHSGLDFRTGGIEGAAVRAVLNGWVSRVKVSASGFGNVIYLDHSQGFTTVYAHLHHFNSLLETYVDSAQQAIENVEVELFPDSGRFGFMQGDVIAISGNSGSSEAPHLHFEIRDRHLQEPLNPLCFLNHAMDSISPINEKLVIYNLISGIYIQKEVITLLPNSSDSIYQINSPTDSIYLGLLSFDRQIPNFLGIYSALLTYDDTVKFQFNFDRFNFNETRFANAHADFLKIGAEQKRLHRLYRLPGDSSSLFTYAGDGLIRLSDSLPHKIHIEVRDFEGNVAAFNVNVSYAREKDTINVVCNEEIIPFGNRWKKTLDSGIRISLPPNALYQNECFKNLPSTKSDSMLSAIYPVFQEMTGSMHKPGNLVFPLDTGIDMSKDKMVILRMDENRKVKEVIFPDSISGNFISGNFRYGGYYAASLDTIPPVVHRCLFEVDPVDMKGYTSCIIKDNLSGLKSYRVQVNGKWKKASWDPKMQKIKWCNNESSQGPHLISVFLTDYCNNTSYWEFAD